MLPQNSKLTIIVFIIVTLELLSIVFLSRSIKDKLDSNLVAEEIKKQQVLTRNLASSIESDTVNIQDKLSLIAQREGIREGRGEECNQELEKAFSILKSKIANLVRADAKGQIYCALNKDSIGIDITKNVDLKRLIEQPDHPVVVHRITFSSVSNQYVAGLHIPVYDAHGKFLGSLGGVIYFNELEEKFFRDLTLVKKDDLGLIDDNGDILFSTNSALIGKNLLSEEIIKLIPENQKDQYNKLLKQALKDASDSKSATVRTHFSPGSEKTTVYYPIELTPEHHWLVSMSIPVEEIINQVEQDPLILGLKNTSVLIIGTIAIVLITQVSLFYYLMAHIKKNHPSKKLKDD